MEDLEQLTQQLGNSIEQQNPDLIWKAYMNLMHGVSMHLSPNTPKRMQFRKYILPLIKTAIYKMVDLYITNKGRNNQRETRRCAFYLLGMIDRHKSTETSTKATFPFGGMGKPTPHRIPEHPTIFNPMSLEKAKRASLSRSKRSFGKTSQDGGYTQSFTTPRDEGTPETELRKKRDVSFPDLKLVVSLSAYVIGDNLIFIIDYNTHRFVYDDRFSDYSYPVEKFIDDASIEEPFIFFLENRNELIKATIEKIKNTEDLRGRKGKQGRELLFELGKNLKIGEFSWRIGSGKHLLWIPDDFLFNVPFPLILIIKDSFIFQSVRSVSQVHCLTSFKWAFQKNIYYCIPKVRRESPKLMFYGVPSTKVPKYDYLPGVIKEFEIIKKYFADDEICSFGDFGLYMGPDLGWKNSATVDTFFTYHADADILWFSGHGYSGIPLSIGAGQKEVLFHEAGIILYDAELSNVFMQTSGLFNFTNNWLIVMNACVTGNEIEINREFVGFPSTLYLLGSVSAIISKTEIYDDIAVEFADGIANKIREGMQNLDSVGTRAQVFNAGLEKILGIKDVEWNPLLGSGYTLIGVP